MKVARFSYNDSIHFGILDEEDLVILSADPMFSGFDTTGERVPVTDVRLLAPVIPRSKVVAIGKNYLDHIQEFDSYQPERPLIFLKPNTSVIGPGDPIVLPPESERVDHEAELVVVIGSITRNVSAEDAMSHVFGFTVGNDVTARDLQHSDGQWARAKGFDTFCPLGPVIETDFNWQDAAIEARLDGQVKQSSNVSLMIHKIPDIIAYASRVFTLLPGDVIMTGTPAGVGPMVAGQTIEISVSGIGSLSNPVRSAH